MAKAVRYHKQGGPEVLQVDDVQVGDPGQGQVRIKHTAIGVNFVDTYQRSGLYPMQLPATAGNEAAYTALYQALRAYESGLQQAVSSHLLQENPGGEVFDLPAPIVPIPLLAKFTG